VDVTTLEINAKEGLFHTFACFRTGEGRAATVVEDRGSKSVIGAMGQVRFATHVRHTGCRQLRRPTLLFRRFYIGRRSAGVVHRR
jgi:hypothetical protein